MKTNSLRVRISARHGREFANKKTMKLTIVFIGLLTLLLAPFSVFANGGDQRVGDGYLINLSRSPFTPISGVKTAMTVSFVDLKTMKLIKDDALVSIRIGKGRGSKTSIHEEKDVLIKGGVLEYAYTFKDSGLHELFFEFTFANDPEKKVYMPPDFLMDIQEPRTEKSHALDYMLFSASGLVVGLAVGMFLPRKPRGDEIALRTPQAQ